MQGEHRYWVSRFDCEKKAVSLSKGDNAHADGFKAAGCSRAALRPRRKLMRDGTMRCGGGSCNEISKGVETNAWRVICKCNERTKVRYGTGEIGRQGLSEEWWQGGGQQWFNQTRVRTMPQPAWRVPPGWSLESLLGLVVHRSDTLVLDGYHSAACSASSIANIIMHSSGAEFFFCTDLDINDGALQTNPELKRHPSSPIPPT